MSGATGRRRHTNQSSLLLPLPQSLVDLDSQRYQGVEILGELQWGELILNPARETMDEGVDKGRLIPATFCSECAELNGEVRHPAATLAKSHQGPGCLPSRRDMLEHLGEGPSELGKRTAHRGTAAPFSGGPGFGPSSQVGNDECYASSFCGIGRSLQFKMELALCEEGSTVS